MKSNEKKTQKNENGEGINFRRYFTHYITKKVYDAHDYGHKSWPIGVRSNPNRKKS